MRYERRQHMGVFCGIVMLCCWIQGAEAQMLQSYKSVTEFFSEAPLEDIYAKNNDGTSLFDIPNKKIVFLIPIRGFEFEKSLMQEHFNENYMESEEFPYAKFTGTVAGFDINVKGRQAVVAKGTITIHGVEQQMELKGSIDVGDDGLHLQCKFPLAIKDYDIEVPRLVIKNIAEVVDVSLSYYYKSRQK